MECKVWVFAEAVDLLCWVRAAGARVNIVRLWSSQDELYSADVSLMDGAWHPVVRDESTFRAHASNALHAC